MAAVVVKADDSDSTQNTPQFFELTVERLELVNNVFHDTLDIILNTNGNELGGFKIKLASNSSYLDIIDILPGDFPDSCQWRLFQARRIPTENREDYPLHLWQAVGMAEGMPDTTRPVCFTHEGEISLLKVVVASPGHNQMIDTTVSIFFFWEDCTDNTLSDPSGDTIFVSRRVIDYYSENTQVNPELFPNRTGTPRKCVSASTHERIPRLIDFYTGGIEFIIRIEDE